MSVSSYLKYKMKSDRVLASHLDMLATKLKDNTISLATDLNSGLERVSWYSSCVADKYNDVCEELKFEDRRMYFAIKQIYERGDVILDIITIYVDCLLKDFDEHKKMTIAKVALKNSLNMLTNRAVKESVAFCIGKIDYIITQFYRSCYPTNSKIHAFCYYYGDILWKSANCSNVSTSFT